MNELENTLKPLPDTSSPAKSITAQTNASSTLNAKPPSYAAAVSGNLSDIVKNIKQSNATKHQ